ncbi:MAG: glycosyltransferase family 2 protein [Faecalimonas umbilicata]|uniref:glycosyltransferase family 2 protein n=1 Tax=Faecalimonas umbilicata TaxID=1912855 RepID=UPI00300EFA40
MVEIKVSIIIPVYNAENYIEDSINSVLCQTYSNIEIIVVNDGSTDRSQEICEKLLQKDNRIVLVSKINEGAGKARLIGVKRSRGDYICFLDADDIMEPYFVEKMLVALEHNNADLVECSYCIFYKNTLKKHEIFEKNQIYGREQFRNNIIANTIIDGNEAVVLWNKIYRKRLIDQYVEIYAANILEDYLFNMQYYLGVEKYVYLNEELIRYRVTEDSLSRKYNPELANELKKIIPLKEQYMKKYCMNDSKYQKKHATWYLNYIYNYLKSGIMQHGFVERTKSVIKDPRTISAAHTVPDHFLAKDINMNRYNICIIRIYFAGMMFWIKRKLYRVKKLTNLL